MYQRSRTSWTKHIDFMILDAIALQLAFFLAYIIRFHSASVWGTDAYKTLCVVLFLIEIVTSLLLNNLSRVLHRGYLKEFMAVCVLALASFAFTALYVYSVKSGELYSRLQLYYTFIIFIVLDFVARSVWKYILGHRNIEKSKNAKALLLVSDYASADGIINNLRSDKALSYYIKGLVLSDATDNVQEIDDIPIVANLETAADYICREWIDEVIFDVSANGPKAHKLEKLCAEMGITVHHRIQLQNVDSNKQFIENIGGYTLLTTAYNYVSSGQAFVKRFFDIFGGLVGSVVAIVIMIIIGPAIYIASPGPIIFKQTRIGKNGKKFTMYKLRSMYLDAEERKKDYLAQNRVGDGMMFKLDFDPRIIGNKVLPDGTQRTGIGEFIRKTSLDEFPQFFNVLLGDMSLVGTRPPTVDEWEKYKYHHRARLAIKPGITGMWQVSGRSDITDFEEVVKLDTDYICNFSIGMDIKILFKTIKVVLLGKGSM